MSKKERTLEAASYELALKLVETAIKTVDAIGSMPLDSEDMNAVATAVTAARNAVFLAADVEAQNA
jgi:hypothetical protein